MFSEGGAAAAAQQRRERCHAMRCDAINAHGPLTRGCEGEVFFSSPLLCSKRITVFTVVMGRAWETFTALCFRSLFSVLIFSKLVLSFVLTSRLGP
jgi:hypothetical protein